MDLFRILICVAFVALLWRIEIRGVRPVRDFFIWGVDYPFHFLLTTTLILMIWGVIGAGFGIQGLFLDVDPLTQVLLGATVMLLFAAITVHYVALGTSRRAWWGSLHRLATFLHGMVSRDDPERPPAGSLGNGFLEKLSIADIEAIDRTAREGLAASRDDAAESRLGATPLDDAPFRLLVAPAVLAEKGFMLIVLVGVVPAIVVPLLNRDPAGCLERLPWLVGVCVGHVLATILGCRTTAWAAEAAGWESAKESILASLRGRGPDTPSESTGGIPRSGPTPGWVTWLFWFFVVHALATFLPSDATVSRWIDWPERTLVGRHGVGFADWLSAFPWLPLAVLAGEAATATVVMVIVREIPRRLGAARRERVAAGWRHAVSFGTTCLERAWALPGLRVTATFAAVLFGVASVLTTILASPEASRSVWLGLRGYASLGAVLACWLGVFWLATHAANGHGSRTPRESNGAAVALAGLLLLSMAGAPAAVVAVVAASLAVLWGSRTLEAVWPWPEAGRLRPALAINLGLVAVGTLAAGWATGRMVVVAGIWTGLSTLFLGSTAVFDTARRRPALLYPLTVLIGTAAFAFPYAVLDERWQAAMPAAGSIACIAALVTAAYTILALARPRSGLLTIGAILTTVMLLNGAALFVAPNEFKGTFPNMASYYSLPVYLDSRDYFRETTPSTSRLRNRDVTEDFDRLARQGASDRLATVYFRVSPLETRADGSHAVILEVEDPRGRIRAASGDRIRLAAEEWFTIVPDGDDLIALAEEPFYRKIFPWFHYGALHVVRDGIIRGPRHPLVKEGEAARPLRPDGQEPTVYRLITREAPASGLGPDVMGLRLIGLQPAYRALGGEYALISLAWTGHVAAVRRADGRDCYRIEFELPRGAEPLDEDQLRTMQSWLERCHIDPFRPSVAASRVGEERVERLGLSRVADGDDGDCVVLEDARADASVPVAVFLAGAAAAPDEHPAFAPHRLTAAAVTEAIAAVAGPRDGVGPASPADRFTLRPAHDRGLFASVAAPSARRTAASSGSLDLAIYGSVRLREGDRLILSWNEDGTAFGPLPSRGAVFEVTSLAPPAARGGCQGCPAGAVLATLRPIDGPAAPVPLPAGDGEVVVGRWELVHLLHNVEVLQTWKGLVGRRWKDAKPKLVIVTLSGGGIRASVWTSVVLRKLEATLGSDFPYHIRLVTGASGGMVAGSYYATSLAPPPPQVLAGGRASFTDLHGISIDEFVERMATDQLDAVAGRMLFGDVPGAIVPLGRTMDRGRTLEETWIRWTGGTASPLGRPLQSYAADERMGWRPSLVYTPMMVEDGRRLLISNLDLAFATRNVGGLLVEPSSRKIERPAIQAGDFDLSIHEEDDVFSLSAVEFFRLFPRAHDFRVTTAIRMSASFPWVSPAVNLPTLPPRRVVDAGYYDNYGVNLTALWLSKMAGWLEANTSGVLVVQVRDKVSQGARTEIDFDRVGPDDSLLDRLLWHGGSKMLRPGLQGVTTPLIGLTNARQWTMAFRNDEQVDLQDLLFDDMIGHDFFRTVVFECPVDVSLNWKLTDREKAILTGGFGRAEATPREELSRVLDFMTGRDSYEFHKWKLEHRNDRNFQAALKERYDEQLRKLGVGGTERLTVRESQSLYENVIKNLKRLEILSDWWNAGRIAPAVQPPLGSPASR